jgi:hypothetical protein
MNMKFRIWSAKFQELVPAKRRIEMEAMMALLFKDLGHPVEEEVKKHPNSRRSDREFSPEEMAEIERRKAEVRAGWTPADFEERKTKIV